MSVAGAMGLGGGGEVAAQPVSAGFGWKAGVSGSFTTASNWEVNDDRLQVKPFVDDTATIPPRAGDSVLFPNSTAAYTVDITGAPPLLLFYFNGASSATFVISGPLVANEFYTQSSGLVTFRGGGSIQAAKFYGVNDQVVFDGLTAVLNAPPIPAGAPSSLFSTKKAVGFSAPAASVNTLLRNGVKLETIGPVVLGSVRLEGASSWEYQSDAEQGLAVTLTGGSSFTAAKTHSIVANGGLVAEGGSTFRISDMTGTRVRLSEGSKMINQDAVAGSDVRILSQISFVDGTGTEWQVAGTFRPRGATGVYVRNGGAMNCGRIVFDDFGGGFLYVSGMGSTLNTVAPLEISGSGSVVASDGGLFTLPSANLNGGGASIEAKGARAEFRSAGAIIARKGRVGVFQGGQGRAQHLTLHDGSGSVVDDNSQLTLAGNLEVGIEGGSFFDIGSGGKVVSDAGFVGGTISGDGTVAIAGANSVWELQSGGFIGDAGKGSLTLSEGGKLLVKGDGAGLAVGFDKTGRGTIRLLANGELDIRSGILAVGKEGEGIVTVNAGTITAGQLLIGESRVTNRVTLTGTGSNLKVSRELVAGNGGTGVLQLRGGARADVRELKVGVESPRKDAGVGVGTVSVENPNTVLSVTDKLSVGASEIGLLAVSAGARLEFLGTEARVGDEGVGVLAVTGDQSRLMAAKAALQVGVKGRGTFEISSGGQVYCQTGQIGIDGTGEVIVGHPEALWQIVSDLEIGADDLGVLTIDDQPGSSPRAASWAEKPARTATCLSSGTACGRSRINSRSRSKGTPR